LGQLEHSDAVLDTDEILDILLKPPFGEQQVLKDDKPLRDEESSVFEKRDRSANFVTIGILAIYFFYYSFTECYQ
jgi:hypothetical protein